MKNYFKLERLTYKTDDLYKRVLAEYRNNNYASVADELNEKYHAIPKEEKISITFIGQYSAGKSTIIKAITGDNSIKIDSDIETSRAKPYIWRNNIILVDTPGLYTGEKEEHDIITNEAIEKSDLLAYCITSDLFSDITREEFKYLAQKYRTKIFLVVNKMNEEGVDYDDLVENYTDSINKTVYPEYSINDFPHFFIDAKDYIKGIEDDDEDYIEDSYFETFTEGLDKYIQLRGYNGKLLVPVNILLNSVENTLIEIESDDHLKEEKTLIKRICDIIEEKKRSFVKVSNNAIQNTANKYIHQGDVVALHLCEEGYEFNEKSLQEFSDPLESELCETIKNYFEQYATEVDIEVQKVMDSEMARHFFEQQSLRLSKEYRSRSDSSGKIDDIEKGLAHAATVTVPKFTEWINKAANVTDAKEISIWSVKGSKLSEIVYNVGHKFGYKFKPYQVLKITKRITEISNMLGPFLTGVGVVLEGVVLVAQKFGERKTQQIKEEIKSIFRDIAESTQNNYREQIDFAANEFEIIRQSLLEEFNRLEDENDRANNFNDSLISLRTEILALQAEIEE